MHAYRSAIDSIKDKKSHNEAETQQIKKHQQHK